MDYGGGPADDPGEPLYLTPYLKSGMIQKGTSQKKYVCANDIFFGQSDSLRRRLRPKFPILHAYAKHCSNCDVPRAGTSTIRC